jgi:hypothetical protein
VCACPHHFPDFLTCIAHSSLVCVACSVRPSASTTPSRPTFS